MKVVVGTDGSPGGLAALRWALDFCRDRNDRSDVLEVVHVYGVHELAMPLFAPTTVVPPGRYLADLPSVAAPFEAGALAHRADLQEHYRREAEQLLSDAIHEVGGARGVHVTTTALAGGDSGPALVDRAHDADLLVVGARGHSRLMSHLLGSVSSYCVHHAPCPVLVTRDG